jgi:hypothetical protein
MVYVAGLATMLSLAIPAGFAAPPSKSGSGTIVIVFKDGHRQSYNLSDVLRVEFPGSGNASVAAEPAGPILPSRGHFLGKWKVGDGSGGTFYITLEESGDAWRSMNRIHGRWAYVNGEAQVSWDDGWKDAIRKAGSKYEKCAYSQGKSFTDTPDNVAGAENTMPHPI